jgi:D-alanyl-D-alanine carboxypeptidase
MGSRRVRTLAALVALAATAGAAEAAAAPRPEYTRTVLARDTTAIRAAGVTGVQARVTTADGRHLAATSGVSGLDGDHPVAPDGYFRIGSTNKTLVATVVLQLVGEGRMGLDDTVERRLPGLVRGNGNDGTRMTVRQLLQHTSGIHDGDYPTIDSAEEYREHRYDRHTPEQIVAAALRHPPDFPPGAGWSYSNTGYVLLGMVVERVTGRPWHQEVHDQIISRLGLRHTIWPGTSPGLPAPHAKGYTRFAPGEELTETTLLVDADASGGYLSTTADLDRFLRALFDGRLLRPRQVAQLRQTVPVDARTNLLWPGARYGLGIFARPLPCGGTAWIPSGDQIGYRTRTGVTADGRRSAVVSMSTQLMDSWDSAVAGDDAARALIDHALCDTAPQQREGGDA